MDTEKQDQKKISIKKPGMKSQIIINPPEKVDPQRGYQEAFRRALQKHTVVVEKKTEVVLQAKAERSQFPADILEQVYKRGFKNLPLNTELTREQYAMNRVNSFIAAGAAMKEDYDLLPIVEYVRTTRGMKGTGGAMRPHIKREKSPYNGRTIFHVVDSKGRVKHSSDDEMEAKKHLATKYNSYMEMTVSPMKRFEGTKSLVKTYKGDTPGEKNVSEEIVTEISQKLKARYVTRASDDFGHQNMGRRNTTGDQQKEFARKEKNRQRGLARALRKEEKMKGEDPCWKGYEMIGKKLKAGRQVPNCVPKNEEVEKLDELSVNKMLKYSDAAEKDRQRLNAKWDAGTASRKEQERVIGREEGENRAANKIKKKTGKYPWQLNREETEQIDELSKKTVRSYANKKQAELDDVPPMPFKKPVKSKAETEKAAKGMMGALARLSGRKPTSEEVDLNEMDKTQTSPGRDGDIDWTKKQIHLGPESMMKAKDVAKRALKTLDKTMKKSRMKDVKEGTSAAIRMQRALSKIKTDRERREKLAAPYVPVKSVFDRTANEKQVKEAVSATPVARPRAGSTEHVAGAVAKMNMADYFKKKREELQQQGRLAKDDK